jgi:histidyl-tRNA synthetase
VENQLAADIKNISAYFVALDEKAADYGFKLTSKIRQQCPHCAIQMNCGGGSIKSQMKRADKSGAKYALIAGEDEINNNTVTVKYLQTNDVQQTLSESQLIALLSK